MSKQLRTSRRVASVRTLLEDKAGHVKWPNRGQFTAAILLVLLLCQMFSIFRPAKANIANSESLSLPSDALSLSVVENVTILKNAYANVSILMTVPDSPLADEYRKILAAPSNSTIGEEIPIPENATQNGLCMPVRQKYFDSIQKDQGCWYGFKMWVLDGSMIARGYNGDLSVSLTALAAPQVVNFTTEGTNGLLDIAIGPRDEKSIEIVASSFFDEITFAQLMLKSMNGSEDAPEYVCLRTMNIALPQDASILNVGELEGLSWAVDLGGGNSVNAWLTASYSSLILTDKTVVTEQNITQDPSVIWSELRNFRIFDVKCTFPNTTWISVACGLNAVDDFEKGFDYTLTHSFVIPYSDSWTVGDATCFLNTSLTVTPTFSFSCYVGWDFGGFLDLEPQWFRTWIAANAKLDVDFKFNLTAVWNHSYTIFNLPRTRIFSLDFFIWFIPVDISLGFEITSQVYVNAQGYIYCEYAGYAEAGFKAGFQWDHVSGWSPIWDTHTNAKRTISKFAAHAHVEVTPSIDLKFSLDLYGLLGPYIEFIPYAQVVVDFSQNALTWSIRFGLNITIGIGIEHNWLTDKLHIGGKSYSIPIAQIELAKWSGEIGNCPCSINITNVSPSQVDSDHSVAITGKVTSDVAGDKTGTVDINASPDNGNTWVSAGTTTSDEDGTFSCIWNPHVSAMTTYELRATFDGSKKYTTVDSLPPYPTLQVNALGNPDLAHIVDHTLCNGIVQYPPQGLDQTVIQPTYYYSVPLVREDKFYVDDQYVYSWLNITNIYMSPAEWPSDYYVHWAMCSSYAGTTLVWDNRSLMNEEYSAIPTESTGSTTSWPHYNNGQPVPWEQRDNWTCWARFSIPPFFVYYNITFWIHVWIHMGSDVHLELNETFQVVRHTPAHVGLTALWPPSLGSPTASTIEIGDSVLLSARAYKIWNRFTNTYTLFGVSDGCISLEYTTDNMNWTTIAFGFGDGGSFDYVWTPPDDADYSLRARWNPNYVDILYLKPPYTGTYSVQTYDYACSSIQTLGVIKKTTMLYTTVDPHVASPPPPYLSEAIVYSGQAITIHVALTGWNADPQPVGVGGQNITFMYSPNGTDWYYIGSAPLYDNDTCSINWTIPRELSGVIYLQSIWYGTSIYANMTTPYQGAWSIVNLLAKRPSMVGVISGANAQIENSQQPSVHFQVNVTTFMPPGWELSLGSTGRVEFSVNGVYIGADEDTNDDCVYEISWTLLQNWSSFGVLPWAAEFFGPPEYADSIANSTLTVYQRPHLVVRGMNNAIYYQTYSPLGNVWTKWTALPSGATLDTPASTECENALHVVVRGMDGSLWYTYLNLTNLLAPFPGWTRLSGSTPSTPTLTSNATFLALVVRGQDNRIYYRFCNVTSLSPMWTPSWTDWNVLPSGATIDGPAAAMSNDYLDIVVRGADGYSLWWGRVYLSSGEFIGWSPVTGATNSKPTLSICNSISEDVCLVVRGLDNAVYWCGGSWRYDRGFPFGHWVWLPWHVVPGGSTLNAPSAVVTGQQLQVVVAGTDGTSMWQNSIDVNSGNSSGWTLLSGATPSAPTLAN